MILYRVVVHDPSAGPGEPGHAEYLHRPQGQGRLDNPRHYDLWYFAVLPEGAIGEVFGNLTEWTEGMFLTPYLPAGHRALARFELPDELDVLDLNDAKILFDRGLRPTQVVSLNRATAQSWALDILMKQLRTAQTLGRHPLVVVFNARSGPSSACGWRPQHARAHPGRS